MFATEKGMKAAQTKPIMHNNFHSYQVKEEERESQRKENFKGKRGRSWDRYSQTSYMEEDNSKKEKQENKIYISECRKGKSLKKKDYPIKN